MAPPRACRPLRILLLLFAPVSLLAQSAVSQEALHSNALAARQAARSAAWDPRADYLHLAAEKATASLFRFQELMLETRSAMKHEQEGDLIYLLWRFTLDGGSGTGWMALKDSSTSSTYSIRWDGASADTIRKQLPQILVLPEWLKQQYWKEPSAQKDQPITKLSLRFGGSSDAHTYSLMAVGNAGGWDAEVTVGKGMLKEHYGETVGVRERFPALRELCKSWTNERVLAELTSPMFTTSSRNIVLFTELARRSPGDDSLLVSALLRSEDRLVQNTRVSQILNALAAYGNNKDRVLRFAMASWASLESEEAVDRMTHTVGCSPGLERHVLEWISGNNRLLKPSISYLGRCGEMPESLQALERLDTTGAKADRVALKEAIELFRHRHR